MTGTPSAGCTRGAAGLVLGLLALLAGAGCGGGARPAGLRGLSVVLIAVDTLRAGHLGSYGHGRDTSPALDALAREGVVFERASATSSFTRESIASLFTGQLPSSGAGMGWTARPPRRAATLARLFRYRGYRTGLFSNSVALRDPGFTGGFDAARFVGAEAMASGHGPALSRAALEWALRPSRKPFFLYAHYLDPHGPYDPPPALRRRFAPAPVGSPLDLYADVRPGLARLRAGGFGPGDPRFEDLVLRYDAELRHTDEAIGLLLEGLRSAGRSERLLVVVTADHGEEFLEHGFVEHAWTLYQESVHVPLIFWAPGRLAPARVGERVSLADVAPSLVVLFGLGIPPHPMDGRPLFARDAGAAGGFALRPRAGPVLAELLIQSRNVVRSVTAGDWKYIAAQKWLTPVEREAVVVAGRATLAPDDLPRTDVFGPVVREELYDLARDPGERDDRAAALPGRLAEMRGLLREHLDRAARVRAERGERDEPLSPEARERLRSLGYL